MGLKKLVKKVKKQIKRTGRQIEKNFKRVADDPLSVAFPFLVGSSNAVSAAAGGPTATELLLGAPPGTPELPGFEGLSGEEVLRAQEEERQRMNRGRGMDIRTSALGVTSERTGAVSLLGV